MSGAVSVGVAAIAIGGAIATEFATFAVIGAIGATVAAVGAVTKVKELQIAGAAIGVVGAVGGLASAAGAFGTGGVFGAGGDIFGGASAMAGVSGSGMEGAMTAANMAPGVADAGNLASGFGQIGAVGADAPSIFQQIVGGLNNVDTFSGVVEPVATASAPAPDIVQEAQPATVAGGKGPEWTGAGTPGQSTASTGAPSAPSVPGMDASGRAPYGVPETVNGSTNPTDKVADLINKNILPESKVAKDSIWADIWDFTKNNKALVGGAVQGAFSFLSGATDPRTPATIQAMEAQSAANRAAAARSNAEADLINQRLANMRGPVPRATRVTGTTQGVGLINSPTVTGVPA